MGIVLGRKGSLGTEGGSRKEETGRRGKGGLHSKFFVVLLVAKIKVHPRNAL